MTIRDDPTRAFEPLRLIGHRGGVVDQEHPENSLAALEAAIGRGYWMVEIDVRESRDGRLIAHHDGTLQQLGHPGRIEDLDWGELHSLQADPEGHRLGLFGDLAAVARGRIRIMLDVKPPHHDDHFYQALEGELVRNNLLDGAYVIGTAESRRRFGGKSLVGVDRSEFIAARAAGQNISERHFLFEHGRQLDEETVRSAQDLGVQVVPSINMFHYAELGDPREAAERDIERLLGLGVIEFQIDSIYEALFKE